MNAGVMYEKAKRPEDAADIYLEIAEKYGDRARRTSPRRPRSPPASSTRRSSSTTAPRRRTSSWSQKFGKGAQGARRALQRGPAAPGARSERQGDRALQGVHEAVREPQGRARRRVQHRRGLRGSRSRRSRAARRSRTTRTRTRRRTSGSSRRTCAPAARRSSSSARPRRRRTSFALAQALYKQANGEVKTEMQAVGRRGSLLRGRADLPRVRRGLDRRQAEAARRGADEEDEAARRSREGLLLGRRLQRPQVGDRRAVSRRSDLRRCSPKRSSPAAAKCPASLKPDECQAYQDAINEKVVQIQDKAVEAFTVGYTKAIQLQVYNDVHREDPRSARPARRAEVSARARGAQQRAHGRPPAEARAGDGGGAMRQLTSSGSRSRCGGGREAPRYRRARTSTAKRSAIRSSRPRTRSSKRRCARSGSAVPRRARPRALACAPRSRSTTRSGRRGSTSA